MTQRTEGPATIPIDDAFQYTRVLDAPRGLVWKAFTESERLMQWWGPAGFTMLAAKVELRPGGVFHYGMRGPDGSEVWGKWVYREIVPPERLSVLASLSDADGGMTRHPSAPGWPLELLSTMTLTEHDGRTTVTVDSVPHDATDAERQVFASALGSMDEGYAGTLDKLVAYLAKTSS